LFYKSNTNISVFRLNGVDYTVSSYSSAGYSVCHVYDSGDEAACGGEAVYGGGGEVVCEVYV
jgi:hypothetical protein